MNVFQLLATFYIIGLLVFGLIIFLAYWNRSVGKKQQQVLATRIACVTASLLWPAFVGGIVFRYVFKKRIVK